MPASTARLLDLTRIVSRAGRVLTGVDRVELAYLDALTADPVPVFGLLRTALGYLLLDQAGMLAIGRATRDGGWGRADLLSRLTRADPLRKAGQSLARRHAIARCLPVGLSRMLRRLPAGMAYINVGHSNLTDRVLAAVRTVPGARIAVLIHDTIPLDFPQFQRDGTVDAFFIKLARVARAADLIICTSEVCRADVTRHMGLAGSRPTESLIVATPGAQPVAIVTPRSHFRAVDISARTNGAEMATPNGKGDGATRATPGYLGQENEGNTLSWDEASIQHAPTLITAHLGVTVTTPDPTTLPADLPLHRPYFVTVGTIEPRKNHALLLDLWDRLGPDAPILYICGSRGWQNADVFARLDAKPPNICELPGLSDAALSALVQGARALLFPSLAEGYGLPPAEALALGTPVICGNLAIWRETLGDRPIYVDTGQPYLWEQAVKNAMQTRPPTQPFKPPTWDAHFKIVLNLT